MLKSLLRSAFRTALPPGTQRWYRAQSLLAVLPRGRGGRPCLQARFYQLTLPRCGSALQLYGAVHLHRPERISIGSRVLLNEGVHITGHEDVVIGDDVMIGPYTVINSGDHGFADPDVLIREQGHLTGPITIEDDTWIAAHCVVLRGVRIGSGAVVGAMSVVREDVPAGSVVAGVPAQVRRHRGRAAAAAPRGPVGAVGRGGPRTG
jgi:galactoside O-acetyltransferase